MIKTGKLADWYAQMEQIPPARRPKTDVFAVGDDANLTLLRMLSRNGGVMEQLLSTEPVDYKLAAFLGKVGRSPIGDLGLDGCSASRGRQGIPLGGCRIRRRRGALGWPILEAPEACRFSRRWPAGWDQLEGRDQG